MLIFRRQADTRFAADARHAAAAPALMLRHDAAARRAMLIYAFTLRQRRYAMFEPLITPPAPRRCRHAPPCHFAFCQIDRRLCSYAISRFRCLFDAMLLCFSAFDADWL